MRPSDTILAVNANNPGSASDYLLIQHHQNYPAALVNLNQLIKANWICISVSGFAGLVIGLTIGILVKLL